MRIVDIALAEMEKMNTTYFTAEEVMSDVAGVFKIEERRFKGFNRKREYTIPRQIFIYVCCMYCKDTLIEIGELMGGRDHTTIIHARNSALRHLSTYDSVFMNYWNNYINNSTIYKKISK